MFIPNREELAWAAGLFDGEGSTCQYGRHSLQLQVTQHKDPEVLQRFRTAVGGIIPLHGPYVSQWDRDRDRWQIQTGSFEKAQAIIAMLWPWLSSVKKEQAKRSLERR